MTLSSRTGPETARPDLPDGSLRDRVAQVLEHVYGPLIVAGLFAFLFVTQDPVQEVLLGFAADFVPPVALLLSADGETGWRSLAGTVLLGAVPVATWSASRLALLPSPVATDPIAVWLPRLAGLAMAAVLVFGLARAATSLEAVNIPEGRFRDVTLWGGLGLAYGAALHWSILSFASFAFYDHRKPRPVEWLALAATIAIFLAPVIWIGFFAPGIATLLGPIGISAAFVIAASYGLSGLTVLSLSAPWQFPLILILVLMAMATSAPWAAAVLAFIGVGGLALALVRRRYRGRPEVLRRLGSEGRIGTWAVIALALIATYGLSGLWLYRDLPACGSLSGCNVIAGTTRQTYDHGSLGQSFAAWQGNDAPVVRLVAAQGGGLFAAYHTAYYLAARADHDPDFAPGLFSISGVSGGSVGAGIYWAIRRSGLCDDAGGSCHRDAVRAILRRDFLSPALAGLLFRDALDSVLPVSYLAEEPIDRGHLLEQTFAARVADWATAEAAATGQALPDGFAEDPLSTALADSWAPDGDLPLLMLNGTEVGTGARRILSPLPWVLAPVTSREAAETGRRTLDGVPGRIPLADLRRDLSVGTAMTISARFPLVTPPARVLLRDGSGKVVVRQLVDGGYFDNSGIETLIEELREVTHRRDGRPVEMLVFSVEEKAPEVAIHGTVGAPVNAFASAWRARRDLTARRLSELVGDIDEDGALRICPVIQRQLRSNFTVSWYLTEATFEDIEIQMDELVTGFSAKAAEDLCLDA